MIGLGESGVEEGGPDLGSFGKKAVFIVIPEVNFTEGNEVNGEANQCLPVLAPVLRAAPVFLVIVAFNIIVLAGPPLHATRLYPVEKIQNPTPLYAKKARVDGPFPHVSEFKIDSR